MRAKFTVFLFVLLTACSDREPIPLVPVPTPGTEDRRVFIGTTREPLGSTAGFGIERSENLRLLSLNVSVPPQRETGDITTDLKRPDPASDFLITARRDFADRAQFVAALSESHAGPSRPVTVFVHGFNTSFGEEAFRVAQLMEDLNVPGSAVAFSWPSRGNPLGYEYDADSMLFSRDGLVDLLSATSAATGGNIVLVGHSMGAALTMEALRQIETARPGWSAQNLDGVILISPDIDPDVFRSQSAAFAEWPSPFVIFKSGRDRILALSARLRGRTERLGNTSDVSELEDLPIYFVDVTALSRRDRFNHFVAGSSPAFLQLLRGSSNVEEAFLRGLGPAGGTILPGSRRRIGNATEIFLDSSNR